MSKKKCLPKIIATLSYFTFFSTISIPTCEHRMFNLVVLMDQEKIHTGKAVGGSRLVVTAVG